MIGTIFRSTYQVLMDRRSPLQKFVVLAWVVAIVAVGLAARPPEVPIPPLNQKVLEFTRERIGKKVADGQCISLAVEALTIRRREALPNRPERRLRLGAAGWVVQRGAAGRHPPVPQRRVPGQTLDHETALGFVASRVSASHGHYS